jgi:hypothetical protein
MQLNKTLRRTTKTILCQQTKNRFDSEHVLERLIRGAIHQTPVSYEDSPSDAEKVITLYPSQAVLGMHAAGRAK